MSDLQFNSLREDLALDDSPLSKDALGAIEALIRYAEALRNSAALLNKEANYLYKEVGDLRRQKVNLQDLIEAHKKQGDLFK